MLVMLINMFIAIFKYNFSITYLFRPSKVISWSLCLSMQCRHIILVGGGWEGAVKFLKTSHHPASVLLSVALSPDANGLALGRGYANIKMP